ncbi:ferredoxin family protein [Desulfosporosinus sp. PR]|uniref:4Fe-4S dicluster domain-containing protein n=1 Tax=Candidatus Desulfosporosinus nitrosoreducens TaxID=3401928 RepID=UPI0027FBB50E|nr:ferredoxin family protein [Desulfosporosinus sp. PR]MDQ7092508.1 ferredoxin family protein [Desulfosporosinus sp. PR]
MRHHHHLTKHSQTNYILINTRLCKACWQCVAACPSNVLGKVNVLIHKHVRINNHQNCQGCLACVKACPYKAISSLKISR